MKFNLFVFFLIPFIAQTKEIALSFDDAPWENTAHFRSEDRTDELIKKLKDLNVPPVMVFAVPCRRPNDPTVIQQLKKYRDAGHLIANHTCTHPRLDDSSFKSYSEDAAKADKLLAPLIVQQKFFRFPYLNESQDEKLRDQMRAWLKDNNYRNGYVSADNDDYIYTFKLNKAKVAKKKINLKKLEAHFVKHIIEGAQFYDDLALKTLGRSPKHVLLLHEMDATVLFIDSLISEFRKQGWKIISAEEAYKDKLYLEQPKNTYSGNGIIAQVAFETTGEKLRYGNFENLKKELNQILDLKPLKE